jgi:hypothetical protein
MPEPTQDSYRTPFVRLIIKSRGTTYALPTYEFVQDFEFTQGTEEHMEVSLTLFDQSWDTLTQLILGNLNTSSVNREGVEKTPDPSGSDKYGFTTEFFFQFGWINDAKSPQFSAVLIPKSISEELTEAGSVFTIKLRALTEDRASMEPIEASWKENTYYHEIAEKIAQLHGWAMTDRDGNSTIEKSKNRINTTKHLPEKENSLSFLKSLTSGARGQALTIREVAYSDVHLETDVVNNKTILHFHGKNFNSKGKGVRREYVFARSKMGNVISYSPDTEGSLTRLFGGEAMKVDFPDVKNKQNTKPAEQSRDGNVGVKGATTNLGKEPLVANRAHKDVKPKRIAKPFLFEEDAKAFAAIRQTKYGDMVLNAEIEVVGDPFIHLHDIIKVDVLLGKNGDRLHHSSGQFSVQKVTHKISAGSYTTTMSLLASSITGKGENHGNPGSQEVSGEAKDPTKVRKEVK